MQKINLKEEGVMEHFKKQYYEQPVFWNKDHSEIPAERERIEEVMKTVPPDVHSILDVGCGNGFFVNSLVNTFPDRFDRVTGLDYAEEPLKYVKTEKLKGSIAKLPFEDRSFDLVTSLEVLEHLPQEEFKTGIYELQRVSKKYIIITVPNDQDLAISLVMCPECYCWFNPYFHMRSFDKNILHTLFDNFKLIEAKEIGPEVEKRSYNPLLLALHRSYRKSVLPETAICPQCGYKHKSGVIDLKDNKNSTNRSSPILLLLKPLVHLVTLTKKMRTWLLGLYEKADK